MKKQKSLGNNNNNSAANRATTTAAAEATTAAVRYKDDETGVAEMRRAEEQDGDVGQVRFNQT
jgi:hypothetical protein